MASNDVSILILGGNFQNSDFFIIISFVCI
jgi:hypothetical protein